MTGTYKSKQWSTANWQLIRHDEGSSTFGIGSSGSLWAEPLCRVIFVVFLFFCHPFKTKTVKKTITSLFPFSYRDKVFRLWPVSDTQVSFIKELANNVKVCLLIMLDRFVWWKCKYHGSDLGPVKIPLIHHAEIWIHDTLFYRPKIRT